MTTEECMFMPMTHICKLPKKNIASCYSSAAKTTKKLQVYQPEQTYLPWCNFMTKIVSQKAIVMEKASRLRLIKMFFPWQSLCNQ